MHSIAHEDFEEEELPTVRETPSGAWIVSVDRASKRLEAAIAKLESGADGADVLDELRQCHALVNGRARP